MNTQIPQNFAKNIKQADVTLKTFAVEEIRSRIMMGQYALGQRLSQNQLAQEMQTSRAPVQDALVTLSHEGIVKIIPQRGSFVFDPTQEEINAMYEVNFIYEAGAMPLAVENNFDALITRLEHSLTLIQNAEDNAQEWVKADRYFHETFIELAGNPYLLRAYKRAIICTTPLVFKHALNHERMRKSFNEHAVIIDYLKEKKIDKAIYVLRRNNVIMER